MVSPSQPVHYIKWSAPVNQYGYIKWSAPSQVVITFPAKFVGLCWIFSFLRLCFVSSCSPWCVFPDSLTPHSKIMFVPLFLHLVILLLFYCQPFLVTRSTAKHSKLCSRHFGTGEHTYSLSRCSLTSAQRVRRPLPSFPQTFLQRWAATITKDFRCLWYGCSHCRAENVTLPAHQATLPAHQATLQAHQATLQAHQATLPAHQTTLPSHATSIPSHATSTPSHATSTPSHATSTPSHAWYACSVAGWCLYPYVSAVFECAFHTSLMENVDGHACTYETRCERNE